MAPTPGTQIATTTSSFVLDLQQQLNQVAPIRENDTALGTEMQRRRIMSHVAQQLRLRGPSVLLQSGLS